MATLGDLPLLKISIPMLTPGVEPAFGIDAADKVRVLVEPIYLGVAAALALDAGWESVELAPRADEAPPIPLVSFEQRPAQLGGRCRVRGDLVDVMSAWEPAARATLLGSLVNARPLAARLANDEIGYVEFVPVASNTHVSSDAWAVCGVLIRLLLEESDCTHELDDAAGMAVSLADVSVDHLGSALSTGRRWRRHLSRGGHEDDLRVAAAIDTVGEVPQVIERGGEGLVVRSWR